MDWPIFVLTNIVFFFTSFVQSVVGFGFNVIGVPFLTALEGAQAAVAIVSIPSFLNCVLIVGRIWRSGEGVVPLRSTKIVPLLIMAAVGTAGGTFLLVALDPSIVRVCLGLLVLTFVLTDHLRRNWRPHPRHANSIAIGVGLVTGVLNGLAGVSGPTLAPYLHTLHLDKHEFVYYLNILFIVLGIYQFIGFFSAGFYTPDRVLVAIGLIPVSLVGAYIGTRARHRVSQEFFNRLVLIVLFVTALDLIRRGLHLF